jgi:hypothetical protein
VIAVLDVRRRVDAVIRGVADRYELRPGDLTSAGCGDRSVQLARHIAVYVGREETGASYPVLGRVFGRDHTTVLHSCRLVRSQLAADADLASEVRAIRDTLNGRMVPAAPTPGNGAHGASGRAERYDVEGQLRLTPPVRPFGWWCRQCGTYTAVDDEDLCEGCAPDAEGIAVQLLMACECPCGRRIQATPPVLDEAPITCGRCGGDFIAQDAGEGREVMGRGRGAVDATAVREAVAETVSSPPGTQLGEAQQ